MLLRPLLRASCSEPRLTPAVLTEAASLPSSRLGLPSHLSPSSQLGLPSHLSPLLHPPWRPAQPLSSSAVHMLLCSETPFSPCPPATPAIFLAQEAYAVIAFLNFSLISLPSLAFSAYFRTQKALKGSEINFSLDKHPNL